jgi:hypothetical protein
MAGNWRRAVWIAASVAVVPVAAVATWWLAGDQSEVDPEIASYLFRAPDIVPATERAAGIVATLLLVAYLIAVLAAALRSGSPHTYLGASMCVIATGALIGVFARILTAGGDGANIGGGLVLLFGLPALLGFVVLAASLARSTDARQASDSPADAATARPLLVTLLAVGLAVVALGSVVRLTETLPATADELGHEAARRVRTIARSGALAAPAGTTVATVVQCGAATRPSVDYSFRSEDTRPIVDALTEQLLTAGWDVHELRDGYRRYQREQARWNARLSMIEKSADASSVTLHLDVDGDRKADCEGFRRNIAIERSAITGR